MTEVYADVYNLEMPPKLQHDRLTITRRPDYETTIKDNLAFLKPTGEAKITVPEGISKQDEVISWAENYVSTYRLLLSLAAGRQVLFWYFRYYTNENGTKRENGHISTVIRASPSTSGQAVYDMAKFLDVAAPLLQNEEFKKTTAIEHAIICHNEGNIMMNTIESKHLLFFTALEALASAFYSQLTSDADVISKNWLFDDATWRSLCTSIKQELHRLEIDHDAYGRFLSRFGCLKDPPIQDKITQLCEFYDLPEYCDEVSAMKEMRNAISHGDPLEESYNGVPAVEVMTKCWWLLQKLIFKTLNFYDPQNIHSMIIDPKL